MDGQPWGARRQTLERLFRHAPPMLSLTTLHAPDVLAFRRLIELGFEGSVIKRTDSRYARGRRTRAWLKLKERRETTVVVRFGARDRQTGRLERAAFTEAAVPGLQWAAVTSPNVRARLEAGARDVNGRIAFSHRSARGAAREARLTSLER